MGVCSRRGTQMPRRSLRSASEKRSSARGVEARKGGGRREEGGSRGAFDFSIKRIQMPSDLPFTGLTGTPTYTSSHHHTPVHMQTDGRSCSTPLCVWLTYIFNRPHAHFTWHKRTPGCKLRHTDTQVDFPLAVPRVQGCPHGVIARDLGVELVRGPDWRLWSSRRNQFTDMLTLSYLEAGGCSGQTHTAAYTGCLSGVWILGFPLLPLYPHLHPKCANLLFREFLSGRIWSLTIRTKKMIIRLLFWYFEALTQIWFVPWGGDTWLLNTTSNPNKQWIRSIITPEKKQLFPAQASDARWRAGGFDLKPAKCDARNLLGMETTAGTWGIRQIERDATPRVRVFEGGGGGEHDLREAVSDTRRDKR